VAAAASAHDCRRALSLWPTALICCRINSPL
jgi:hypothetical protein